jgi:hypothetical protein
VGWALDVNHRWMTIEGLAYMAFSYVSCHPERIFIATNDCSLKKSALDSLLEIAGIWEEDPLKFQSWIEDLIAEQYSSAHPELARSGLQYRIAMLLTEGHPLIYVAQAWIDELDTSTIWKQLHYIVALLYGAEPGNFIVLHLITALHAIEKISDRLPAEQQKYVIRCFWIGMLCILFSRGEFPKRTTLESLNLKYKDVVDDGGVIDEKYQWDHIIKRGLCEEEEHNPKMVYALKRMWSLSTGHRSIFRIVAAHFTTTPELPKSFETAPTES